MTDPLYPIPENPVATKFIFGRARPTRDEHGRMLLDVLLDAGEREIVHQRLREIGQHIGNAKPADVRKAMLEAFPDIEADVAKERAKRLAEGLDGLPLFAARRAALRQVGAKEIDRVQLRIDAEAAARPYWNEASIGSLLLHARINPAAAPSLEARARIAEGFAELREALRQGEEDGDGPESRKARKKRTRMANADARVRRIRDYEEAGLEPVFADKGGRYVVTLPLLQKLGWRVEEMGDGSRALIRPEWLRRKPEETRT